MSRGPRSRALRRFALALVLACAALEPAPSRVVATEPPRQEVSIAGYRCLTYVMGGAKPEDRLPLIVGLHFSSATPEAVIADFDAIDVPARILLPQGRYARREGYSWFPNDYGALGADEQKKVTFAVLDELSRFVGAAAAKVPTIGKPIVAGTSYGGDLAFLLGVHHPGLVQAAFPVAARFLPEWMPASSACAPRCPLVLAMHGQEDRTVPMAPTRQAAQRLSAMGIRVEFREYPGVAHDFSAEMKRDFTAAVRDLLLTASAPAATPR